MPFKSSNFTYCAKSSRFRDVDTGRYCVAATRSASSDSSDSERTRRRGGSANANATEIEQLRKEITIQQRIIASKDAQLVAAVAREQKAWACAHKLQSDWLVWKQESEKYQECEKERWAHYVQNLQSDLSKAKEHECNTASIMMVQEKLKGAEQAVTHSKHQLEQAVTHSKHQLEILRLEGEVAQLKLMLTEEIWYKNYLEQVVALKPKDYSTKDCVIQRAVREAVAKPTSAMSASEPSGLSSLSDDRDLEPGSQQPPMVSTSTSFSFPSPSGSTTAGSNWADEQDSEPSSRQSPMGPNTGIAGLDGDVSIAVQDLSIR